MHAGYQQQQDKENSREERNKAYNLLFNDLEAKTKYARIIINRFIERHSYQWNVECAKLTRDTPPTHLGDIKSHRFLLYYMYFRQKYGDFLCQTSIYNKGEIA